MPRTNYQKGRDREYYVSKKLKEEGYDILIRSAGSHKFADLIAIKKDLKVILFVQVKPKKFSEKAKERLLDENEWVNDDFIGKFVVL
jgi:Holliday junction resolvase